MPLSPEDQALIDLVLREVAGLWPQQASTVGVLSRLIEASRAEERAKAEGEVEELKDAARRSDEHAQKVAREAEDGFAALEEVDAAWEATGYANNRRALTLPEQIASLCREIETAESNLAKAEARIAETVEVLEWMHRKGGLGYAIHDALEALLAKLKAAPLQGGGSSSSRVEENSPSGRTSAPSSTGGGE